MFYFQPYWGKIIQLTNIFQMGSNHQLALIFLNVSIFHPFGRPRKRKVPPPRPKCYWPSLATFWQEKHRGSDRFVYRNLLQNNLHSLTLTAKTLKISLPKRKLVVQPSIFRCELLVSGRVMYSWCVTKYYRASVLLKIRINTRYPYKSRWWFHIFFIFTPSWGRFRLWLIFFNWVETTN